MSYNIKYYRGIGQLKYRVLALVLFSAGTLYAQSGTDEDINSELPIQSEWNTDRYSVYSAGDKTVTVTLGGLFPLFFTSSNYSFIKNNMNIGGTGSLTYTYYLNPGFFIGGELQGSFSSTIGEHFVFIVPLMVRMGQQIIYNRFEFPLSVSFGAAPQIYNGHNLISLILKGQGSAYFRFNADWSFGVNTALWWVPQWTSDSSKNSYGHFFELSISARYHF